MLLRFCYKSCLRSHCSPTIECRFRKANISYPKIWHRIFKKRNIFLELLAQKFWNNKKYSIFLLALRIRSFLENKNNCPQRSNLAKRNKRVLLGYSNPCTNGSFRGHDNVTLSLLWHSPFITGHITCCMYNTKSKNQLEILSSYL